MKNNITYRIGKLADLKQLKKLGKQSFAEFEELLDEENRNKLKASLNNEGELKELIEKSEVFVAEYDSEIIGMIYFIPSGIPTKIYQSDWSHIRFLGVDPKQRGKGIAKKLVQMCIDHAKQTKETTIALHTSEFMDAARSIYENIGFQRVKEIERLGRRYWVYLMKI